jgi:hypothetical protein
MGGVCDMSLFEGGPTYLNMGVKIICMTVREGGILDVWRQLVTS